ncbi:MAG: hypothetical protein JJU18_05480 [Oceanicaulis sp.]|nr:hypothetical protein [Oceanicaulis sp.]
MLRLHDAATPPFSAMLSVIIVATAFIWVLFFLFGVVALNCAQLVAVSLQGAPGLPGAALLFITAFVALGSLWLIDVMRAKTGRTGVVRRVAEGLLIAACLYSSLVHYAFLRPMTPEGRMIMAVYEGPGGIMMLGMDYTLLEMDDGFGLTPEQVEARLEFALGPPDPVWYPRQRGGGRCTCLNRRDEHDAIEHREIDWHEAEGIGDPVVLAAWRERLGPRPETPDWCEAALAPVRYPY